MGVKSNPVDPCQRHTYICILMAVLTSQFQYRLHTRFYYGWVHVLIAALAMVGTLPGRTQGLGLITEPLLKDLGMDRILFAQINLWATLTGALFCLGIGRLIDRFGSRVLLSVVSLALGAVVLMMSRTTRCCNARRFDYADTGFWSERSFGDQFDHRRPVVCAPAECGNGNLYSAVEYRIHDCFSCCRYICRSERLAHRMEWNRLCNFVLSPAGILALCTQITGNLRIGKRSRNAT